MLQCCTLCNAWPWRNHFPCYITLPTSHNHHQAEAQFTIKCLNLSDYNKRCRWLRLNILSPCSGCNSTLPHRVQYMWILCVQYQGRLCCVLEGHMVCPFAGHHSRRGYIQVPTSLCCCLRPLGKNTDLRMTCLYVIFMVERTKPLIRNSTCISTEQHHQSALIYCNFGWYVVTWRAIYLIVLIYTYLL